MRALAAIFLFSIPFAALAADDETDVDAVHIDFDAMNVNGMQVKPFIEIVDGPPKTPVFKPLIQIRREWKSEMKQSVNEIR